MTRTNRSMSEPPTIDLSGCTTPEQAQARTKAWLESAEPPQLKPDDTGFIDPDQAGSMVMLSACIIAGMVLTFALAIGWSVHHQLHGRIDRLQADLKSLHTFASCDAPAKPGDTTVITIRRTDHQLATRCQVITNPRSPERALQ